MNSSIFKKLMMLVSLIISPFIMVTIMGIIYVVFQMLNGVALSEGINSFSTFIKNLAPYFPYLTIIPMVAVVMGLVLKNKDKARKKSKA